MSRGTRPRRAVAPIIDAKLTRTRRDEEWFGSERDTGKAEQRFLKETT